MTDKEKQDLKESIIAEVQKDAEKAKEQKWFVHGHVQWLAIALFAVTVACNLINTFAPNSKAGKEALLVEHTISGHPVIEKLVAAELQKLLDKAGK